jgi:hypothetical protein
LDVTFRLVLEFDPETASYSAVCPELPAARPPVISNKKPEQILGGNRTLSCPRQHRPTRCTPARRKGG